MRVSQIVLTVLGLAAALFTFDSKLQALGFGLAVFLFLELLSRIAFSFRSLYVHPFPTFDVDTQKWTGMAFGVGRQEGNPYDIPLVGPVFSDAGLGRNIYELLLQWASGERNDEQQSIGASVIVLNSEEYLFFCYPNFDREEAETFFERVEEEQNDQPSHEHFRMGMLFVLGRRFRITSQSRFPEFRQRYRDGVPILFHMYVRKNDHAEVIPGTEPLILHSFKIRDQSELTRRDMEYDLVRMWQ